MNNYVPPDYNCPLCPRLVAFREANRMSYPAFYNAPVLSFGDLDAELLVVGLAPGLKGANQTGRPFTGDYAGIILYSALQKNGFAQGDYNPEKVARKKGEDKGEFNKTDGFKLVNCRITNSVRCVPQANKPEPSEIKQCNKFLSSEFTVMPRLKVIVTLGQIAHKSVISAFGLKQSQYVFGHAAKHHIGKIWLINSYHTSRYNINTGTLTQGMFDDVIATAKQAVNQ